jgi:hypothetical protein
MMDNEINFGFELVRTNISFIDSPFTTVDQIAYYVNSIYGPRDFYYWPVGSHIAKVFTFKRKKDHDKTTAFYCVRSTYRVREKDRG